MELLLYAIDNFFIAIVLPAYASSLVLIFNVNLSDDVYKYSPDASTLIAGTDPEACLKPRSNASGKCIYDPPEMFEGIHEISVSANGVLISCIVPAGCITLCIIYAVLRQIAYRKHLLRPQPTDIARANRTVARFVHQRSSKPTREDSHSFEPQPPPRQPEPGLGPDVVSSEPVVLSQLPTLRAETFHVPVTTRETPHRMVAFSADPPATRPATNRPGAAHASQPRRTRPGVGGASPGNLRTLPVAETHC